MQIIHQNKLTHILQNELCNLPDSKIDSAKLELVTAKKNGDVTQRVDSFQLPNHIYFRVYVDAYD